MDDGPAKSQGEVELELAEREAEKLPRTGEESARPELDELGGEESGASEFERFEELTPKPAPAPEPPAES